jgi:hypothetical protein
MRKLTWQQTLLHSTIFVREKISAVVSMFTQVTDKTSSLLFIWTGAAFDLSTSCATSFFAIIPKNKIKTGFEYGSHVSLHKRFKKRLGIFFLIKNKLKSCSIGCFQRLVFI